MLRGTRTREAAAMAEGLIARVGRWCFRRRWWVLALWLLAVTAGGLSAGPVFNGLTSGGGPSSLESVQANTVLLDNSGQRGTVIGVVDGIDPTAGPVRDAVRSAAADLMAVPGVVGVVTPYSDGLPRQRRAAQVARDGHALAVTVQLGRLDKTHRHDTSAKITDRLHRLATNLVSAGQPGATVRVGGSAALNQQANDAVQHDLGSAEEYSLPITLVILVFVFGGLVADRGHPAGPRAVHRLRAAAGRAVPGGAGPRVRAGRGDRPGLGDGWTYHPVQRPDRGRGHVRPADVRHPGAVRARRRRGVDRAGRDARLAHLHRGPDRPGSAPDPPVEAGRPADRAVRRRGRVRLLRGARPDRPAPAAGHLRGDRCRPARRRCPAAVHRDAPGRHQQPAPVAGGGRRRARAGRPVRGGPGAGGDRRRAYRRGEPGRLGGPLAGYAGGDPGRVGEAGRVRTVHCGHRCRRGSGGDRRAGAGRPGTRGPAHRRSVLGNRGCRAAR
ncbi:MAG: hypothetical protein E6G35_14175 [Actinobacteria bacterium]|nr:MAG: hypothetical protein E6G35_14175 [Actinomycetota bacterium]